MLMLTIENVTREEAEYLYKKYIKKTGYKGLSNFELEDKLDKIKNGYRYAIIK